MRRRKKKTSYSVLISLLHLKIYRCRLLKIIKQPLWLKLIALKYETESNYKLIFKTKREKRPFPFYLHFTKRLLKIFFSVY